jgi:hypothetical protein
MKTEYIKEILDEGIEIYGSLPKAFEYLMRNWLRRLFPMGMYDEPKFTTTIIEYNGKKYKIDISENGCCEVTAEHRIMYWNHTITELE